MFRTLLCSLLLALPAICGPVFSNAVLKGSATLNGTNVADEAFVSNTVVAAVAGRVTEEQSLAQITAATDGLARVGFVTNTVNASAAAFSNDLAAIASSQSNYTYTVFTNLYGSIAGLGSLYSDAYGLFLYMTNRLDGIETNITVQSSAAASAAANAAVAGISNYMYTASNSLALADAGISNSLAEYASTSYLILSNFVESTAAGLSNSIIALDGYYGLSSALFLYMTNRLNGIDTNIIEQSKYQATLAATSALVSVRSDMASMSNALSAGVSTVASSVTDTSNFTVYAVGTVSNYATTASSAVSNYASGVSIAAGASFAAMSNFVVATRASVSNASLLELSPRGITNQVYLIGSAPEGVTPTGRIVNITSLTSGWFNITIPVFTNSSGEPLGAARAATNESTQTAWPEPIECPFNVARGTTGWQGPESVTSYNTAITAEYGDILHTNAIVRYFDAIVSTVDPVAASTYPLDELTNSTITIASAVSGFFGTVVLTAAELPISTNVISSFPLTDPYPAISAVSNVAVAYAVPFRIITNAVHYNYIALVPLDSSVTNYLVITNGVITNLLSKP